MTALPARSASELSQLASEESLQLLAAIAAAAIPNLDLNNPGTAILFRDTFSDVSLDESLAGISSAALTGRGAYNNLGRVREALARRAGVLAPPFEEAFERARQWLTPIDREEVDLPSPTTMAECNAFEQAYDDAKVFGYEHPAVKRFASEALTLHPDDLQDRWHRRDLREHYSRIAKDCDDQVLEAGGIEAARQRQDDETAVVESRLARNEKRRQKEAEELLQDGEERDLAFLEMGMMAHVLGIADEQLWHAQ